MNLFALGQKNYKLSVSASIYALGKKTIDFLLAWPLAGFITSKHESTRRPTWQHSSNRQPQQMDT